MKFLLFLAFFLLSLEAATTTRRFSARLKNRIRKASTVFFPTNKEDISSLSVVKIVGDGNCQFRALAQALYGDQNGRHKMVREKIAQQIETLPNDESFQNRLFSLLENGDHRRYSQAQRSIETIQKSYQNPKDLANYYRKDGVYGDYNTLIEAAKIWNLNIVILDASKNIKAVISSPHQNFDPRLIFLQHFNDHYNLMGYKSSISGLGGSVQTIFDAKTINSG